LALGPWEVARDNFGTYAANTLRAYRSDWRDFSSWALYRHLRPLPAAPGTLALYVAHLGRVAKTSTISRRMFAISQVHRAAGMPSPTEDAGVKAIWARIRRAHETPTRGAAPFTVALLGRVVESLPDDLSGRRDRALLLVGFAGALRRSELVGLDVQDVEERGNDLVLRIRASSTDPEGMGRIVDIPRGSHPTTCPVRALRAWTAGIDEGPLFRPVSRSGKLGRGRLSPASANRALQRAVLRAGLDPKPYSAQSLRAGGLAAATSASRSGSRGRGWW
jgi:integrase